MGRRTEAARAAGKVSVAVLISRILGLVREQVMAAVFGAGMHMDAWLVAFRIPNMFRDLFAEGALSSAFIPTFTRTIKQEGRPEAWLVASLVLNGLLLVLGVLGVIFFLFSDGFVYLLAGGYADDPTKFELTSRMLKILSPFLILVALASVAMGMLNTLGHFFLPALAPAFFNIFLILAGVFAVPIFESWGKAGIYAIAFGAIVGGFSQFAVQLPLLRREGFRYSVKVSFRHPAIRKMAGLIAPAILGVSAVQINIVVNTYLASLFGDGPVSWLSYAFRLIYLPIGLFGVAVGVVNLREVSSFAAQERWEELKETVANSIKLISLLAMPSMVGLIVLAGPVIRLLYERGRFTPEDTRNTAYALICYSIGLMAYSCIKVYVPTFYALDDTRTPVRISLVAVFTNLVVNVTLALWVMPSGLEFVGLALGTSISVGLNMWLLARALGRRVGSLAAYRVRPTLLKTLAAAVLMGVAVHLMHWMGTLLLQSTSQLLELLLSSAVMVLGAALYFGLCGLFSVEEVKLLWKRMVR